MEAKELYLLGCRFPPNVIPDGLHADVPRVTYDEKLGWVGEFWYFISGSPIPRMYAKLHLPDGLVLEIRKLSNEAESFCSSPKRALTQAQNEYLERFVQAVGSFETAPKSRYEWNPAWMQTHTQAEKTWFQLVQGNSAGHRNQDTAPPKWLVEYWTAERVHAVLTTKADSGTERLLPTDKGRNLWHLARDRGFIRGCIPAGLEPGLPRLSYSQEYGWVAEYWYYYANAAVGLMTFPQPKYYLRISLSKEQVLEVKNLTGQLQFSKSWLDVWAGWMYESELDYLAVCEQLMARPDPSEREIIRLQGRWLEAHPTEYALWLISYSHLSEDAIRWILSPHRMPGKDILCPLWFMEMRKGIWLGTPDIAELCVKAVTDFELCRNMERRYAP